MFLWLYDVNRVHEKLGTLLTQFGTVVNKRMQIYDKTCLDDGTVMTICGWLFKKLSIYLNYFSVQLFINV